MLEELVVDPTSSPNLSKMIGDDDLKTSYVVRLVETILSTPFRTSFLGRPCVI